MNYTLHTDNIELSDFDRAEIEKKLARLEKHLVPPFTAEVAVRRNAHHRSGDVISCSVNINTHSGKKTYHAERERDTVLNSLDEVVEALSRELSKDHGKHKDSHTPR